MTDAFGFAAVLAAGRSDGSDRLISADDLLARLQHLCGGELPGPIAIPAVLERVRAARRLKMAIGRPLELRFEGIALAGWLRVEPCDEDGEHDSGCRIVLHHWEESIAAGNAARQEEASAALDALLGEGVIWLDAEQRIIASELSGEGVAELAERINPAHGKRWTDVLQLRRGLVDGSVRPQVGRDLEVALRGSSRRWHARLKVIAGAGPRNAFRVSLRSAAEEIGRGSASAPELVPDDMLGSEMLGSEFGPAIRDPLDRIIAAGKTIRDQSAGPLAHEYREYAGDIVDAARHLSALASALAEAEFIDSADFRPALESVDLAAVAREGVRLLAIRARERDISVRLDACAGRPLAIGNRTRVMQILLNLLGNAIAYAPAGSEVRIACGVDAATAFLQVIDEGSGISKAGQKRLFRKFERLGRSGDGGAGLGLYISSRLAEAMGGSLELASREGEGARFTLSLPAAEA